MPHLRPVQPYLVRNTNGKIHIVDMRDYHGNYEKTLCGRSDYNFAGVSTKDISDIDPKDPDICKRCLNSYFD